MSLSTEIIKILDALAEKVGIVVDWTSENVLPYIEKLSVKFVNYELATSVVWLIFGIICVILSVLCFKKMTHFHSKSDGMDDNNDNTWFCVFFAFAFVIKLLVGLCVTMTQLLDIVTCCTFPEKVILDELKVIYTNMQNSSK